MTTVRNAVGIREHSGVFERVIANVLSMRGDALVTWWLDEQRFTDPGPYDFYLQWAERQGGEFVDVAGPTSGNSLFDPEPRQFAKIPLSAYRVRLATPLGEYFSDPVLALGSWNRHDYLIARDVVRREYLRLTRYVGSRGSHLARRSWGTKCPRCTDFHTGMVADSNCNVCYGTGFVGGYYLPITLWVEQGTVEIREKHDESAGVRADTVQTARAVAFPYLVSKDVWVNDETDARWSIESKRVLAELRGVPLVLGIELRLFEPSSVAYEIPMAAGSSSS